jgi:hypothetical protein
VVKGWYLTDVFYKRLQLRVQFWIFTKFPIILGAYCKQYQSKTLFTGCKYSKYVDGIRGVIGLMVKYQVIKP